MNTPENPTPEYRPASSYRVFDLIIGIFVTVLIVSNIASSAKLVDWGFSLYGVRMIYDAGTVLFPISYIFGDILTEVYGYRRSRRVIWTGFICLAFSALVFRLVQALPGEAGWQSSGGPAAYGMVLYGMSSGGIVLASLSGYWAGEFSNSFLLAKMKILTRGRWLWMRTIGSTIVGELVDTVVFVVVADLFHVFGWNLFVSMVLTNYIFKCSVEALMTPVTYAVVNWLKRVEREDYYDYNTDFNPFQLGGK
jgi:queuosine precursor transporter